jgi:SAM-dependent methyltransferase
MSRLYSNLASWWPLLSAPADYAEEAEHHRRVITGHARRPIRTVLELGCGGGNNAVHLKHHFHMTLTDLSPQMLAVSRAANPECEHVEGDMRCLCLGRTFDAVFVHDAVMYMKSEDDLRRALATAFTHCAADGVALFVPDFVRETWRPQTSCGGHDGAGRSLRYLEWTCDPDPADTQFTMDMVCALREGDGPIRLELDRHEFGLFPEAAWLRLLAEAGFTPCSQACNYEGGETARSFVGVRND